MEMYKDKHEIQAEINAREILLRQTQDAAFAHLENMVSSLLAKQTPQVRQEVIAEVGALEKATLAPDLQTAVRLQAENDNGVKSQRQKWRDEMAQLEAQMKFATDPAGADGEAM